MPTNEERLWAAGIYVLSFFTTFIGPLVIWLLKKNDSDFVDYYGREYFNFLISYAVYTLISSILIFVLVGVLMLWVLGIMAFIFTIIAAIRAYEGKLYKIPLVFRIL
ncbi:DUF4870 domain-containing protein [Falsibacillus pallidus]|uniref:Tic20 family protein n=1 Tax=Falsibacillus pallidus TaxID=493781 RepID=A0A370GHJ7_9BACI|nr:DUF4870 domain-containing protein [Falsibacillus pallidus]RDI43121.1 hypothetical protein DFR59_104172 [Falsibacillus pallidus]